VAEQYLTCTATPISSMMAWAFLMMLSSQMLRRWRQWLLRSCVFVWNWTC